MTTSKPRPPASPAMWYNANGHEWGQVGPNGERLGPGGEPVPQTGSSGLRGMLILAGILLGCALVAAAALGLLGATSGGGGGPGTGGTPLPATYGPPGGEPC